MANISRRGFLAAAATCTAAAGLPQTTAYADGPGVGPVPRTPARPAICIPVDQPPESASASGEQGTVSASVTVSNLTDNVAIYYTISNTSSETDTYTVSYTDQVTTQTSASVQTLLSPGQSFTGLMHGSLNHDFVFTVDLSDGTVLTLGPVGELPVCEGSRRPYPKPIYGPAAQVQREQPVKSLAKPPVRQNSAAAFRPPRGPGAPTGLIALPLTV